MKQKYIDEVIVRGYAIVPSVLQQSEVDELRKDLEIAIYEDMEHWKDCPYYGADRYMVHNLMMRGKAFLRLLEHPLMHEYLSAILSDTCILYAFQSSTLPGGGTNYSNRIHIDCPRLIPSYMTNFGVIFPLDDFLEENGATYFMPFSQETSEPPSEEEFMKKSERAYCNSGDMIICNPRIWHRGGINKTTKMRHAVTLSACRSYMRQRFDFPRMIPENIFEQLGETARRFLGYNVRVPTSLEEYYVAPEQRLYKSNQG